MQTHDAAVWCAQAAQAGPVALVRTKGLHFNRLKPLPGSLCEGSQSDSHPRPQIRQDDMRSAFGIRAVAAAATSNKKSIASTSEPAPSSANSVKGISCLLEQQALGAKDLDLG